MEDIGLKLQNRTLDFIESNQLFSNGDTVVLAVSGGADSVCLLHIFSIIGHKLCLHLHVAHLNHQLRGKAADADASYVSRLAHELKISGTFESRDVRSYQSQKRISLEEASREVRYAFFADVIKAQKASCVVVAHTRDDQVETILLHLIRGVGIEGLRGLQPRTLLNLKAGKKAITIIRPLLQLSRAETEAYCDHYKLKPRLDVSNLSASFRRNRIRHELIPALKTYNPAVEQALLRLASIAAEQIAFLDELTSHLWSDIVNEKAGMLYLDIIGLSALPTVLQKHLMRRAVEYLCGDTRDVEAKHLENMLNFLEKPAGKILLLPHHLQLRREYHQLRISLDDNPNCPFPGLEQEYEIIVPGQTIFSGWRIKCSIFNKRKQSRNQGLIADFDLDKSGKNLFVRARRRGDKFQPLGMKQSKKLYRFMSNVKIQQDWRDSIPLVCTPHQIIWVTGWRIAESVKVTESTRKVLRIAFEKTA